MSDIRVLIVADDPLVRTGLAALLADRCVIVGQVSADDDFALEVYRPDALLWDLGWESGLSSDRIADLSEDGPPIVVLLPDNSDAAVFWSAGSRGLLRRDASGDRIAAALASAAQGLVVFDPALTLDLPLLHPTPPVEALTPREIDVLRLLAEGLPNKGIALRLDISEHTVKFHINALMSKLHAQSRTEAVVQAIRLGVIAL
jgi:DNA-binding NarL/FixJ family response regulator